MKSFVAFLKKDFLEELRCARLLITTALFVLLGIMNPAVAKLTPWFLEIFSDSLAGSGIVITDIKVSAIDSWVQFFKNIPIGLIAFVLLHASVFTNEYNRGTLVLSLTKGLKRYKVILSKSLLLISVWSVLYWMCFGITYLYNDFYWDNSTVGNIAFSVFCTWLFGMFVISLLVLFSAFLDSTGSVLLGCGGIILLSYIIGFVPKLNKYLPTFLSDGTSLIYGTSGPKSYVVAIIITALLSIFCFLASVVLFRKKQL